MSKTSPIATAYQTLLSKGRLQPNPSQAKLVQHLGQLQQTLLTTQTPKLWPKLPTSAKHSNDDTTTPHNGIYIHGGVGTGKSRLADLFTSTLPSPIRARRTHFHEFMLETHTRLHRARSQHSPGDPLLQIGRDIHAESPVLCLDEFQVSDIADAMILQRLFGAFWGAGGVVVSTSNRRPDELYLNGLNRGLFVPFIRELERRCVVWRMEGRRDYRMDHEGGVAGRVPVFFTDAGAFEESLRRATGGTAMEEVEINVMMGRRMRVLAAKSSIGTGSKAVVQGSFATLCETSLGSSDYHALCAFASTIYISGLYRFRSSQPQLDYVRRLITLVDIAYEYRTRIVCLADAPLAEIFQDIGIDPKAAEAVEAALTGASRGDGMEMTVKGEGGSSSSMMSTFVNGNVEWSATGLRGASLAADGAGETDVKFAVGRAISRLTEMGSEAYGVGDE